MSHPKGRSQLRETAGAVALLVLFTMLLYIGRLHGPLEPARMDTSADGLLLVTSTEKTPERRHRAIEAALQSSACAHGSTSEESFRDRAGLVYLALLRCADDTEAETVQADDVGPAATP
jgi:hypothetical protein